MATAFTGFPPDFFRFFRELAKHNDRAWFTANKPRYRASVVTSMDAFIEAMAPKLEKISPHFLAEPGATGGSMFRIYRDVRFSKDKRPYKEHAGCQFRHEDGRDVHAPGFYVQISHTEVLFGGGIWKAASAELTLIRQAIADDPKGWKRATSSKAFKERLGEIEGEQLKRAPRGFDPDLPHMDDIRRKSLYAMASAKIADAKKPEFVDEVAAAFRAANPLMRFLTEAVGLPY